MSDVVGRTFVGEVYIRPLGRGICLGADMIDFEDWFPAAAGVESVSAGGETVRVRITVERLEPVPTPEAQTGGSDA